MDAAARNRRDGCDGFGGVDSGSGRGGEGVVESGDELRAGEALGVDSMAFCGSCDE